MSLTRESLLLLKGDEIFNLFQDQEKEILNIIKEAYQTHAKSETDMPPNAYLRFPNMEKERIIAKAAYLGGSFDAAGIKWIASFPNNLSKGLERASATLIMNDSETGFPTAILESSVISAKRTAASAALAAQVMYPGESVYSVGMVGCGLINFETLRFLLAVYPMIETVHLQDLHQERAIQFKEKINKMHGGLDIQIQNDFNSLLKNTAVIAIGTTAVKPFISSLENHLPNTVILHTSLRDLTPEVILSADNVVDDIEQICSNKTSIHLAEMEAGNRDFIQATIGDILSGNPFQATRGIHIFNPFGLGILDIALATWIEKKAMAKNIGLTIDQFFPTPWTQRN